MTAKSLLVEELKNARGLFEGTIADVKPSQLHKDPGGKALPLGATIAHLIFSEDAIVQGMLQGIPPLFATRWKGKTGASSPMPDMDANWSANNEIWAKSVKIDLPKLLAYKKAVFAATDRYMESLKDADLGKEVDLGNWGKHTVADLLYGFVIGHTNSLSGEISVLKGLQGFKGYPF